jgi:hypothetical protein
MQPGYIYEEKLFSKWITLILGSVPAIMFFLLVYQLIKGPIGTNPAPNWFFVIMGVVFLVLTIMFSRVIIQMTPERVSIGYGLIKHKIPWGIIENCHLDETPAVRYGGSGIRVTKIGEKWRIVYSIVGGPRVVLSVKEGKYREVAFSTKNQDQVMSLIKQWARIMD